MTIEFLDSFLSTLTELVCLLILRKSFIAKRLNENIMGNFFVLILASLVIAVRYEIFKDTQLIFNIMILIILLVLIFKMSFYEAIIQLMLALTTVMTIEFIIIMFFSVFIENVKGSYLVKCGAISLTILFSLIIYYKVNLKKVYSQIIKKENKVLKFIVINSFIAVFSIWFYWDSNFNRQVYNLIYIVLILVIILTTNLVSVIYLEKIDAQHKALEAYNKYNPYVEELIKEIRKEQHDYKNRLHALMMLPEVCDNYDDLVKEIQEYTNNYKKETIDDKIQILKLNNKMLGALLYYKINQAKEMGIIIDCEIEDDCMEGCMPNYEIVDIVGILVDNAIEATATYTGNKHIKIEFKEKKFKRYIIIKNTFYFIEKQRLEKLFKKAYSTKGSGRGYGLSNVEGIINKYPEIMIQAYNEKNYNENYVVFEISCE
ncbi:sensor histidine kinase [Clostridium grantii]|uniref:GHKL domain-containing protein n=1 Tax=Clostridium grantii DSM 8605 TaxID=1121316 RepID=A0A1M5WHI7_9CLOT|nr:GHKL domain-containing protein [Clostridium grantii]SHH86966.1 GHKL domain-containing protein [Clostridium grantii DSM 8605]